MKLSSLLSATLATSTLAALAIASGANASPTADRDYVTRAVPSSSNQHDVFKRLVKVPRTLATAAARDAMMPDHAAMCARMMEEPDPAAPAPKG